MVNVSGRIYFHGFEETIQKNGKTLRKQEAVLTDNTASIRMVLWESDIAKVTSGSHYTLSRAVVREYDGRQVCNSKQKVYNQRGSCHSRSRRPQSWQNVNETPIKNQ